MAWRSDYEMSRDVGGLVVDQYSMNYISGYLTMAMTIQCCPLTNNQLHH